MGVIRRHHLFLCEPSRVLVFIVAQIRVLVFLGLVIYMHLIIEIILAHLPILLRLELMVITLVHTYMCLLGLLPGILTRELAIMSVVMRRLFKILLRISDIVTRETLLKGHIRDGLYHFSLPDLSTQSVSSPVAASIELQNKTAKGVFAASKVSSTPLFCSISTC